MSVGNSEKWVLVEWGNCTRGIVHSRYLVNVEGRELEAGCSVVVGKRGEQQIATFLARSNDRLLLDQILKQAETTEETGAGPSEPPPADEEPGDFSGSASSWAPSENDVSESSEAEDDKEEKYKPNMSAKLEEEQINRERTTRKVLTPSNKVNAIIPNCMRKDAAKGKNNKNTRKRKHEMEEKENVENKKPVLETEQKVEPPQEPAEQIEPRMVNVDINMNDVIGMKKMFKELFKIFRNMRQMHKKSTKKAIHKTTQENNPPCNAPEEQENDLYEREEEELNRSDDNVLITNKYDNIENNTQDQNKEDVYNIQSEAKDDEWIPIGSGKTLIHKDKFRKIKWTSYTMATRGLLLAVFARRTLATHSLTGKRSPAFQNKPAKMCLDPKKVSDIIIEVMDRFRVRENLIRSIITTKCADECKMFKMRMDKKKGLSGHRPKVEAIPEAVPNNEQNATDATQC